MQQFGKRKARQTGHLAGDVNPLPSSASFLEARDELEDSRDDEGSSRSYTYISLNHHTATTVYHNRHYDGMPTSPPSFSPRSLIHRRLQFTLKCCIAVILVLSTFITFLSLGYYLGQIIPELQSTQGYYDDTTTQTTITNYGTILSANNVDAVYSLTFWGKNRLCKTLAQQLLDHDAKNNATANAAEEEQSSSPLPILVNMTLSCQKMFHHPLGTGNWLWLIYAMRMASEAHGNVDFVASCYDDSPSIRQQFVIPWVLGEFGPSFLSPNPTEEGAAIAPSNTLTKKASCKGHLWAPMWHMIPALQYDLRRMARALVGIPTWHRTNDTTIGNEKKQHIELDETVWHMRCGDVMSVKHAGYAWHKFDLLASHINNDTQSIGIVTQPFNKGENRKQDLSSKHDTMSACKRLAGTLVMYLQKRFPSARVSLRNDSNESVALAYSRMIVAKQVVLGGVSTFGVYAALASYGQAIMIAPDFPHAPGRWLLKWEKIKKIDDNVTIIHDPSPLIITQAQYLWWHADGGQEAMIEWLTSDSFRSEPRLVEKVRVLSRIYQK